MVIHLNEFFEDRQIFWLQITVFANYSSQHTLRNSAVALCLNYQSLYKLKMVTFPLTWRAPKLLNCPSVCQRERGYYCSGVALLL
jgi:hypothetical protein